MPMYVNVGDFKFDIKDPGIAQMGLNKLSESLRDIQGIFREAEKFSKEVDDNKYCKGLFKYIPNTNKFFFCTMKDGDYDICIYDPVEKNFSNVITLEELLHISEQCYEYELEIQNTAKLNIYGARHKINQALYSKTNEIANLYYNQGYSPAHPVRAGTNAGHSPHRQGKTEQTKFIPNRKDEEYGL